jgi:hypothetical protein
MDCDLFEFRGKEIHKPDFLMNNDEVFSEQIKMRIYQKAGKRKLWK